MSRAFKRKNFLFPRLYEETDRAAVGVDEENVEGGTEDSDVLESALSFHAVEGVRGINEQGGFSVFVLVHLPHSVDSGFTSCFETSTDLEATTSFLNVATDHSHSRFTNNSSKRLDNADGSDVIAFLFERDQSTSEESGERFRVHKFPTEPFGHIGHSITEVFRRSRARMSSLSIPVQPPAPFEFSAMVLMRSPSIFSQLLSGTFLNSPGMMTE